MQIVIDIPEEMYTNRQLLNYFGRYSEKLDEVIKNGTLLDKIRVEIMSKDGLEDALEIIDKYIA